MKIRKYDGYGIFQKISFWWNPLRKSEINQIKNCIYRALTNKMSSGQISDGYESYNFPKKNPFNKTTYESQKE